MRLLVQVVGSKEQRFLFDCNLYLRSVGAGEESMTVTVIVIVTATVPATAKLYSKFFG